MEIIAGIYRNITNLNYFIQTCKIVDVGMLCRYAILVTPPRNELLFSNSART